MSTTLHVVQEIIHDVCDIPQESIQPEAHLLDELGIDSVDFLDIVHEIDRRYAIKLPVADWADAVNRGESESNYFLVSRLVESIERLKSVD